MLFTRYCTAALLCAVLGAATVSGQAQGAAPAEGRAEFLVFVGGRQIGQEQVNVAKSGGNWIITATGQLAAPAETAPIASR